MNRADYEAIADRASHLYVLEGKDETDSFSVAIDDVRKLMRTVSDLENQLVLAHKKMELPAPNRLT